MAPNVVVLMGPAGAGKTTVGERLAESLGWPFADADAFHPASNVEKMRRGEGLTDADRAPWLAALREAVRATLARGDHLVLACSALRRSYREALVPPDAPSGAVRFAYLHVSRAELARRLATRVGHYAPPSLLDSQLATLEEPAPEEGIAWIDGERPVPDVVAALVALLRG
ncbi:carbohydrate kinase, thermoresistant glucokinase family [Gemmatirosa kalamazoonensis]|uniref:Gluconokinase n=1 Tax=Gemmatirosa kalamazoonensis TaxID=861299 RepID=W0RF02_9BACT|nr:gluconokinase [Gemmatirosa kalamazoonensis]AHG88910.1 carbohydrate kinase, thermoresistant glucokinase family [Gemmatirosa kalamazoonensis]